MFGKSAGFTAWLAARVLIVASICAPRAAAAETLNLNLAWDANPEPDIASYYVHVGTSSGNYNLAVTPVPGNQLTFAFPATPGVRYYFAVKAVNIAGEWSPSSAEVVGGVPTFTQPASQTGAVGTLITPLQLSAVDPDGGALQFSASNLPAGLSISTSGRITGTPTTAGSRTVTVAVFDGTVTVQRSFTWTINTTLGTVSATSAVPGTGSGWAQTFTLTYADSLGATDLDTVSALFNPSLVSTPADSCMVAFKRSANLVSLLDDAGSSWASATLGTAATLENAQCSVTLGTSSVIASGTSLQLKLAMGFKPAFSGFKNVYLSATSAGGQSSGWVDRGDWTVPTVKGTITSNVSSPRVAGTSITFTGSVANGRGAYEYRWRLFNGTAWTVLREWGAATVTWTPTAANANYQIEMRARLTGSTVEEASATLPFVITSAPTPVLTPASTNVALGTPATVSLTGASGSGTEWLAIAAVGAPNSSYIQYMWVGAAVTTRTWSVPVASPGTYEFRLFRDGYIRVATSVPVTVTDPTPPALTVSTTIAEVGTPVTVTLTNGRGGAVDWLAFAPAGAANTNYLQWVYVGEGVTTRTWTVTMPPTVGTFEFRLFLNNGYTRVATSPSIATKVTLQNGTTP